MPPPVRAWYVSEYAERFVLFKHPPPHESHWHRQNSHARASLLLCVLRPQSQYVTRNALGEDEGTCQERQSESVCVREREERERERC
jgi:hypothetical protein